MLELAKAMGIELTGSGDPTATAATAPPHNNEQERQPASD
jgi:hypothetical protein